MLFFSSPFSFPFERQVRKRDRSFEFPELLLLLPHARVHYAVRILDASRIRSGSGYARGEIVKLRGGGCSGARDRSGLCITLELGRFRSEFPPRRGYTRLSSTFPTPLITPPIISWTITGRRGAWLFKWGWGKKETIRSTSAALIARETARRWN